ncbi:heat shock 70 kDa protein 12A-like isoform X2 [Argiope bruennichi]|uniref:heat shock 70 kDa protein 12A-like isoform X2 n=1 Tax=Argiope bruennichi TaxID=94029 RepID=UPI0024956377|nr:heat shock 70 kDa protein 12A-like isoform X2 [Argiope bruennichi]
MSIRDRTVPEQQSVVALISYNKTSLEQNNNAVVQNNSDSKVQERTISPAKRAYFRRRILPPEIFNDLQESCVDPPREELSTTDRCGGIVTSGVWDSRTCGRAITVVGSPVHPFINRSKSVDYSRRYLPNATSQSYANRDGLPVSAEKKPPPPARSLVCQECSGGTFFGIYHTPTSRRKTTESLPVGPPPNESRWERTSLPSQSTFTSTTPTSVLSSLPANKTFHYTPELRYKPVYFGDPRFRRYSCGYSERRPSAAVSGLQDFCRTMLTPKQPDMPSEFSAQSQTQEKDISDKVNVDENREQLDGKQTSAEIHSQKGSKQTTPLRSPKLVKEVLKRMSSHPSGRDPQVREAFSDEEDPDFYVDKEAMKVIDEFERSLTDLNSDIQVQKINRQDSQPNVTDGGPRDQTDNLVEEVLLSERKFEKIAVSESVPYSEKFMGREEIEEARRYMSLTTDQKSKRNKAGRESPAPPKPPRNYDSLPRGFKTSTGDSSYDVVSSGIHPLMNGHSTDSGNRVDHPSSSPQQNYFVVVAIDFGTTYSGYAFSFTQDPDNIHMMRKWEGGDPGVVNQKTPTTLLLDPEERFHSFGYAARDCYHDLEPQEAKKWLYFEKFKMTLHKTENLSRDTIIYAANGKGLSALTVFAHALRYFRKHALQELSDQSATCILNDDVRWVVTVPAIWRQPAKQFMRNAAYEAGIASKENPEQLLIALEPEAASIFCRRLRQHQLVPMMSGPQRLSLPNIKENPDSSLPAVIENAGTRYMVVDCGGGTVDITVHEITDENGTIKELHKATGGPYGSVGIDLEFEKLLADIFGTDFLEHFKNKLPAAFVDLMVAFEARKRNASPFKITPINIALPFSFVHHYKKMKNTTVENTVKKYNSKEIKWSSQGMLRLEPSGMTNLFQPTLDAIRMHVAHVLDTCESSGAISYLFLVGGFAESAILQKSIRDAFSDRLKVIIPQGVSLAILKGAVQFGIDPTVVSSRRSRLTYGVGVLNRFIHGTHPPDKLVVKDGVEWCADVFDKFVLADQSVCVGDTVIRRYTPARSGQACSVIHIYCSERDDVNFITDPGVKRCGTLVLDLPDEPKQPQGKREIQTIMIFGDTELKVSAMDVLTGRCVKAEVDFLNG